MASRKIKQGSSAVFYASLVIGILVLANIVASRYDAAPNLVAGSVLVSSLVSLVTITALLTLMH